MFPKATLVAAALAFASTVAAAPGLRISVSAPASVNGVQDLKLSTTLTNTGDEILRVLNDPESILDDLDTDTFSITSSSGSHPSFTGAVTKYSPEAAAADGGFTILNVGESITVEHDLASTYDFTDAGADDYTFVPHNRFQIVKDDGSIEDLVADFEETTAKVEGVLAVERRAIEKRAEFPGCTAARSSLITTAYGVAATYATNAKDYLAANTGATQRYTTWFGAANASRRSTVVSHFQKISAGNFASYTYDCSCTRSGVYAYVYSNQPGKMWLCPVFWQIANSGTDSKAGTIVHEASHWSVNGGTSDYVYGQSGAKSLATSNPGQAVMNADNHEYFVENTPNLP
ncbi:hypothetical protein BDV98DRAFT_657759 [Pterulicium gracile]|uniref:Lysine-specific metallo-endopeptidase domain-containing protein n=1 Tax=Pterulicium gracile TaxID=1884261 RepID=A0A5C3Q9Q9_9AGAR|nr:hypothetical protein BDV98DRAFT_657759 [Pterula gracilis]